MHYKQYVVAITLILLLFLGVLYVRDRNESSSEEFFESGTVTEKKASSDTASGTPSVALPQTIVSNLSVPWDIVFLPSGDKVISEREGRLLQISSDNKDRKEIIIPGVRTGGEGGLLGIVLHPDFKSNSYLYLYFTSSLNGAAINNIVRYRFAEGTLVEEKVIIDDIPGALFHNGGRMAFGPDGLLYVATGDAANSSTAQDLSSLAGKVLRMDADGNEVPTNPFQSLVFSYGHRNPQGLTWDEEGNLWSTEHGRSGILSGLDELNLVTQGGNYGWPQSQGDTVEFETIGPATHSGSNTTWAPASAVYWDGSIFFGGLKGKTLYEAVLDGKEVLEVREYFADMYGRIRTITVGPDGFFYMTTSNRDGRGKPALDDDRIIKIDPRMFR